MIRVLESQPSLRLTARCSGGEERRLSILVVDDDAASAEGTALLLKGWRHHVQVAYDGEQAIRLYEAQKPDLVLLDIAMPGMNGYEVARRLSRRKHHAHLVAVTGLGEPKDRQRALASGFDEHFVKPIDPSDLRGILARV